MLTGIEKTLLRNRKTGMKKLMSKNRENYQHTISILKKWRKLRVEHNQLQHIHDICEDSAHVLTQDEYDDIRNYFIGELIIPNGQRSGIISGVNISEIEDARNQITVEGYHRIMISEHKTGFLQSATIFVYADVFWGLHKFVMHILSKIPAFQEKTKAFTSCTNVFNTFNGDPITSSQVTPLLRKCLKLIGLDFKGNVTDFRRAAATLTGQINPSIAEKMALFLGHSRRVHDRHYRIQLGHFGLAEVFTELGMMQSNPYSCNISSNAQSSVLSYRNTPNSSTNTSFDYSNIANKPLSGSDANDKVTPSNRVVDFANDAVNRGEDDTNNSLTDSVFRSVDANAIPCLEYDSNSFNISNRLGDNLSETISNICLSVNDEFSDETRHVEVVTDETRTVQVVPTEFSTVEVVSTKFSTVEVVPTEFSTIEVDPTEFSTVKLVLKFG